MNAQHKPTLITHEELQAAIRKFQQAGGIITKLPDQPTHGQQSVAVKWGFLDVRQDSMS
jgi:hypothetical protein